MAPCMAQKQMADKQKESEEVRRSRSVFATMIAEGPAAALSKVVRRGQYRFDKAHNDEAKRAILADMSARAATTGDLSEASERHVRKLRAAEEQQQHTSSNKKAGSHRLRGLLLLFLGYDSHRSCWGSMACDFGFFLRQRIDWFEYPHGVDVLYDEHGKRCRPNPAAQPIPPAFAQPSQPKLTPRLDARTPLLSPSQASHTCILTTTPAGGSSRGTRRLMSGSYGAMRRRRCTRARRSSSLTW